MASSCKAFHLSLFHAGNKKRQENGFPLVFTKKGQTGTPTWMLLTNTDLSKEIGRKNQNAVLVKTSQCFADSEMESKCLMVFFPQLPVVGRADTEEGTEGDVGKDRGWR